MENKESPLEERTDSELMHALVAAGRVTAEVKPLLAERVLARLKEVPGFPIEKISVDSVEFDFTKDSTVSVYLPALGMKEKDLDALQESLEKLPGVNVKPHGSIINGIIGFRIVVRFDQESTQGLPSKVVGVQEEAAEKLHGV